MDLYKYVHTYCIASWPTQRFDWQMLLVDSGNSKLPVKNSRNSTIDMHKCLRTRRKFSMKQSYWSLQTFMQYLITNCRAFAAQQQEKLATVFMS